MNDLIAVNVVHILADLPYILAGILALGVVVFVHEWGHFMAGRRAGIRAEAFSIGFGPILWRKRVGETEYRLSAILFGGYVKFAGMEGTEDKTPQQVEGGFYAVSPARRIFAAFAGPFMNVVLAFVLFFILWGTGRKVPESQVTTVIGAVKEGSPAEAAGFQPGDRIVSISGRPVEEFRDVVLAVALGGKTLDVAVERDGEEVHADVTPKEDPEVGARILGVEPAQPMTAYRVLQGSAAAAMGLQKGDLLVRLDGKRIYSGGLGWQDALRERAGQPIALTVIRDGEEVVLSGQMPEGTKESPPQLGFFMAPTFATIYEQPFEAAGNILNEMWRTLRALVTRRVKAKALAGPVGIVNVIILSLKVSFTSFLWLAALISLNLAIINLLPIPVVDGGHIMFSVLEVVRRKPVREKTMVAITNVFAVLIIAFFAYVTFNDIVRVWKSGTQSEEEEQDKEAPASPDQDAQPDNSDRAPDNGARLPETGPGARLAAHGSR